ncbi:MAG: hypothetical protein GX946_02960 [Oligosphaeraceae bacterium]|nr:hypothetical protein [Oligosphaeraceae bacterium]
MKQQYNTYKMMRQDKAGKNENGKTARCSNNKELYLVFMPNAPGDGFLFPGS